MIFMALGEGLAGGRAGGGWRMDLAAWWAGPKQAQRRPGPAADARRIALHLARLRPH